MVTDSIRYSTEYNGRIRIRIKVEQDWSARLGALGAREVKGRGECRVRVTDREEGQRLGNIDHIRPAVEEEMKRNIVIEKGQRDQA